MGERVGVDGFGYEGLDIDEFCDALVSAHVTTLVDVRLNALSRKRGFSKNGLRASLAEVGIEYLHRPVLGNPKENRDGFALLGSRAGDAARNLYRGILAAPSAVEAIFEIATLARSGRVAVMCFERDQHECHRELVVDQVEEVLRGALEPLSGEFRW